MPTWALLLAAVVFLAALAGFALTFTHHHPPEQEDPWPANDATSTAAPEK